MDEVAAPLLGARAFRAALATLERAACALAFPAWKPREADRVEVLATRGSQLQITVAVERAILAAYHSGEWVLHRGPGKPAYLRAAAGRTDLCALCRLQGAEADAFLEQLRMQGVDEHLVRMLNLGGESRSRRE